MMKQVLLLLACLLGLNFAINAQECYNPTYKSAKKLFDKGEYKKALNMFEGAKSCPDKPSNENLDWWINECRQLISSPAVPKPADPPQKKKEVVYAIVDQQPEFPTGEEGLNSFLKNNIRYPQNALNQNLKGKALVQFIVNKDGTIENPEIIQSFDPSLDEEAIRVVKLMPKWLPGYKNGQLVRVRYTLPVAFEVIQQDALVIVPTENLKMKEDPGNNVNKDTGNQNRAYSYHDYGYQNKHWGTKKSAFLSGFLSFLIPGVGQMYNGQVGKGVLFMVGALGCSAGGLAAMDGPEALSGSLVICGAAFWIWSVIDAPISSNKKNRENGWVYVPFTKGRSLGLEPDIILPNTAYRVNNNDLDVHYGMKLKFNF